MRKGCDLFALSIFTFFSLSVFTCQHRFYILLHLPVPDLLHFARVDLSSGQGTAARACLLERVPYFGVCLSESHCKKLEVQLTDFVVTEMKKEGSTHYRPEACQDPGIEESSEAEPKAKAKGKAKPKPKAGQADAQGKKNKKTDEEDAGEGQAKKKHTKTEDEQEAASDAESLPW